MTIGGGVMAVWNDLEPGYGAEFDTWYRSQHVPERLQQPGFLEARRYLALDDGAPRYCAFYWLESIAALATPQYLARLAQPTRWTKRMMPRFRDMARTPCTVTLEYGAGIGGMMIWLAATGEGSSAETLRERLARVLPARCGEAEIVRAQLWECDRKERARRSPEERFRAGRDRVADWIVCIEGAAAAPLTDAARGVQAAIAADADARSLAVSPCYRLMWRMCAREAPAPRSDDEAGVSLLA